MGAILFGRYLDLTIAPIGGAPGVRIKADANGNTLRVGFHIKRTATSAANEAEIEVYNLSPQNRTAIDKEEQGVVLEAGFEDVSATLLVGDIRRGGIHHRKEGPDFVTRLEVRDGGRGLYGSRFSGSYKAGTPKLVIVQDIVGHLAGVEMGYAGAAGLQGNTSQRVVLAGMARICLDKVCRAWGVEFSVQNGSAQFLDPTQTRGGAALAIKLTPTSGLIGSPAKTNKGCQFDCLLMADMIPGSPVQLADTLLCDGFYRVQSLEYVGDSRAPGAWRNQTVEAVRL